MHMRPSDSKPVHGNPRHDFRYRPLAPFRDGCQPVDSSCGCWHRDLWRLRHRRRYHLVRSIYIFGSAGASRYDTYKISIGRSLLLGLEVLVAADIVKTIAIELTFTSLGLLAGLVLVRTFLSWTLVLEIEGRWPWQRDLAAAAQIEREGRGQI